MMRVMTLAAPALPAFYVNSMLLAASLIHHFQALARCGYTASDWVRMVNVMVVCGDECVQQYDALPGRKRGGTADLDIWTALARSAPLQGPRPGWESSVECFYTSDPLLNYTRRWNDKYYHEVGVGGFDFCRRYFSAAEL